MFYPLGNSTQLLEIAIFMVDLPMKKWFSVLVLMNQRVHVLCSEFQFFHNFWGSYTGPYFLPILPRVPLFSQLPTNWGRKSSHFFHHFQQIILPTFQNMFLQMMNTSCFQLFQTYFSNFFTTFNWGELSFALSSWWCSPAAAGIAAEGLGVASSAAGRPMRAEGYFPPVMW